MTVKPFPTVVDLYHGDTVTDFAKMYAYGVRGIIHKASQGANNKDNAYKARKVDAQKAGLLWGSYHFASDEDVEAQVNNYLNAIDHATDTLLCLDFEPNGNHTMSMTQCRSFLTSIFAKTGRQAVLYSGNLIKEQLGSSKDPFFAAHRLWLAQYGATPRTPITWSSAWLWQYSGDGIGPLPHTVPGASGNLDVSVYDGTEDNLRKTWL